MEDDYNSLAMGGFDEEDEEEEEEEEGGEAAAAASVSRRRCRGVVISQVRLMMMSFRLGSKEINHSLYYPPFSDH